MVQFFCTKNAEDIDMLLEVADITRAFLEEKNMKKLVI